MACFVDASASIDCPAHGKMELVHFGSDRHARLLDNIYMIRSQKKNVSCRQCDRTSLIHDLKFFYCPTCHYTRCIFCDNSPSVSWNAIKALLEACPQACGKLFAGGRILLHEMVCRKDSTEAVNTYLSIYRAGAMIADSSGELPLHWAAHSNFDIAIVKRLVEEYPDSVRLANQDGNLPLHIAIKSRNPETVKYLLNLYPEACQVTDSLGWLPLHYAVNGTPEPDREILELCLATFPNGCEHPNYQGFFPLHLYIRNKAVPAVWVLDKLIAAFPFAAFITTGEQDELPLHVLAARSPPAIDCVKLLVAINPDGVFQKSKETAWADAATPLDIAVAIAWKRDSGENQARGIVGPLEDYWATVRIMLLTRPKYDEALLRECNYRVRRGVLLTAMRLFSRKYPVVLQHSKYVNYDVEERGEMKVADCDMSMSWQRGSGCGPTDVMDVLAELYGVSPVAFRKVMGYL